MGNTLFAFSVGILLGIIFFGGLQWTVMRIGTVKHPAILMASSMIIRMAIMISGLFLLRDGSYWNLPVALLAVILIRFAMIARAKQQITEVVETAEEGDGDEH